MAWMLPLIGDYLTSRWKPGIGKLQGMGGMIVEPQAQAGDLSRAGACSKDVLPPLPLAVRAH